MKPKHNPWYLFNETVILYHGTSSAFLPIIKTKGLVPPDENLEEYAHRIVKQYLNEIPADVADKIRRHTLSFRSDAIHKVGSVIYLSGDFQQAKDYANSYYRFGGEIGHDVWRWVNQYIANNKLANFNTPISANALQRSDIHIKPIYDDSHPIIVEVEIPSQWMMVYGNLKDKWEGSVKHWKRLRGWYKDRGISFKDYLDTVEGIEVRVGEVIAKNMIRRIHDLPKSSLLRAGEPES